jgi:hypothetical protein
MLSGIIKMLDHSFVTGYDPSANEVEKILKLTDLEAMQSDIRKVNSDMQKAFEQLKNKLQEPQRALKSTGKRAIGC